jgi:hypothetical protein
VNADDAVLRVVCDPLPVPIERAWRACDRLSDRLTFMQRNPPSVENAEREFGLELLETAFEDGEPAWPSPVDVLAARQNLEAHQIATKLLHSAHQTAEVRLGRAIASSERELVETLDDMLGALQDDAALHKAAHAVPVGVGGDGLLAAGPDTAGKAALLGDAAGHFNRICAARRVMFRYVPPQSATWMDVVAEHMEDGMTWKSQNVRGPAEPKPWGAGLGGELHYAIVHDIRLRVWTAAQLDEAGYQPGIIYVQSPIRAMA